MGQIKDFTTIDFTKKSKDKEIRITITKSGIWHYVNANLYDVTLGTMSYSSKKKYHTLYEAIKQYNYYYQMLVEE